MHCDKHDIDYEQKETELFGHKMLFGSCPACEIEFEEETRKAQERRDEESRISRYRRANIEPMYFDVTLDGFDAGTPELAKAKETIQKLIETRSGKILMLGKNGTGKTHLAVCAVKAIGGAIYTMYEITIRIQASYGEKAEEREQKIVDELANLPLLAIDEIGRTKGSDAEERWLSYIIDKRNSRDLPLILISNKHTKKTCQAGGCKDCLENYISEDIMSRLCVGGKMLNFTGEDWRKKR